MVVLAERLTFFFSRRASIATNQSYKRIAVDRGQMDAERVFVVRSAPDLRKFVAVPPDPRWKRGKQVSRRVPGDDRAAGGAALPGRGGGAIEERGRRMTSAGS